MINHNVNATRETACRLLNQVCLMIFFILYPVCCLIVLLMNHAWLNDQSIVSLINFLVVKILTVLVNTISNSLGILA